MVKDEILDYVHNQLKYRGFTIKPPYYKWTHPDGHMIRVDALVRSESPVIVLREFLSSCGLL